uniref:Uncharacterized protein n=1 Tax=Plectus sambesii TaxID=2011161 RepID=A0A914WTX9_9BILA
MARTIFQHERGPKFVLKRHNKNNSGRDESGMSLPGPTMVAVLPVARQTGFLHALYYGLMRHHLGHDDHSIYDYGQVQTITFLSAASFAQLIGPPRFPFISKAAKMWSLLIRQMFDVRVLDKDGFSIDYFSPTIRLHGKLTGEKFLRKRDDIVAERFYPISLTPKTTVTIGGRPIYSGSDVSEEYSTLNLMKYFYWNTRLLREKQLMLIAPILNTWFPLAKANGCFNHLEGRTIKSLSQKELDDVFWLIAEYMKDPCKMRSESRVDSDLELSPFQLQFAEFFDDQTLDPTMTLFAD